MSIQFAGKLAMIIIMGMQIFYPRIATSGEANQINEVKDIMARDVYFAGGCFWGVQEYFSRVPGVLATRAGYAQSNTPDPDYDEVCSGKTNAAETVKISYDPEETTLGILLRHFFRIIDPTSLNRQGNDIGTQYRTGIYYTDPGDLTAIEMAMAEQQKKHSRPLAVETMPLANFYPAEAYHQNYLKKNPLGYCHINFESLDDPSLQPVPVMNKEQKDIKLNQLTPMERNITQENGTEPPFSGAYWNFSRPGIYVDIVSGQPLFSSRDKFHSACGWPAFSAPISHDALTFKRDNSHGMNRVEARSKSADSHLGHVFNDGPAERGGLRYCINSAALRFVPREQMEKEGYGAWLPLIDPE